MNDADIDVSVEPLADRDVLGREWRALEAQSSHSIFTSWSWIGHWLARLPSTLHPLVLRARYRDATVGLAILMKRRVRQHRVFVSDALYLNETGDPYYDQLTIEHNGILARRDLAPAVIRRCLSSLLERTDWEEFFLNRLDALSGLDRAPGKARVVEDIRRMSYFVDLARLRAEGKDYLSALGANTRSKLRQTLRSYATDGETRTDIASSPDEALAWLDCLIEHHQRYWNGKGLPGAFANPFFTQFHRDLIRDRFAHGEIQLVRVSVGQRAIGYIYNLVQDQWIYNYQTGLQYEGADTRRRPGVLCHHAAINYNLAHGARCYDFMAGNVEYKRALSTDASEMIWARVQRDKVKFHIRDGLKSLKRRLVARTPRAAA